VRLAPLSEVLDGTTVARDVLSGDDRAPLLRSGVSLTPEYRSGLVRAGVHAIYIEDECSEGIEPPRPLITPDTQALAARAVAETYAEARRSLETRRPLPSSVEESLSAVLELMLSEVRSSGEVALALRDLCTADAYTFQHSIDVTALGMFLGMHVFSSTGWSQAPAAAGRSLIDERLLILGMGLLVHDIGKLAIPHAILHKPGRLSPAEREIIEEHPQTGFDLLAGSGWSPLVKAVVLRHHERWNGTGYPDGLSGNGIHQMARIAAVADVYDAITSERPYAPAMPAHEGVRAILAGSGTQFDPGVVAVFRALVAPFPPGVEVRLDDGRRALVVDVPAHAVDRPRVRVLEGPGAPSEVDLAREAGIGIAGWPDAAPAQATA